MKKDKDPLHNDELHKTVAILADKHFTLKEVNRIKEGYDVESEEVKNKILALMGISIPDMLSMEIVIMRKACEYKIRLDE